MGAFIGTVTTAAIVTEMLRPKSSTRVIEGIGKSFSNSLGAAMGQPPSRTNSVSPHDRSVWEEGYELANGRFPELRANYPVPYFWAGIYYRALSLFPLVTTPYMVDWAGIAERLSGVSAADDMELVGEVLGELWDRYGL